MTPQTQEVILHPQKSNYRFFESLQVSRDREGALAIPLSNAFNADNT